MADVTVPDNTSIDAPATTSGASQRGPLVFAALLSIVGIAYILLGSVTVVPFIKDERRREPIRKMWAALGRDLPDIGHPSVEKIGFWVIVAITAILSVAVLLLAATVSDAPETETDPSA